MSATFEDVLDEFLRPMFDTRLGVWTEATGTGVLKLSEMQAIRSVISAAMVARGYGDDPVKQASKLEHLWDALDDLSVEVSEWVVGGKLL